MAAGRDGKIDEVDAAGNLIWRMQIGAGFPENITYRAEKIASLMVDTPCDSDGDWDLDMVDFAELQVGFTDSGPAGLSFPDTLVDHDRDDDIDPEDVDLFGFWMTGPGLVF